VNSILHKNKIVERRKAFDGCSTRLSSVDGLITGLIVVSTNGEDRGVICRVVSQS
jgi:hypothetical protein